MLFDVAGFLDKFSSPSKDGDENLFRTKQKAWGGHTNKPEPRCDFAPNRHSMVMRGVVALTLFKRSPFGQCLSEVKTDPGRPDFIAMKSAEFLRRVLSPNLDPGQWAVVTPPARRHLTENFAQKTGRLLAGLLGIECHVDVAICKNKKRVNAIYTLDKLPTQNNLIVFDDIITTGSTFISMDRLLTPLGKNCLFFAAINNKD